MTRANELKVSVPKIMADNLVVYVRATGVRRAMWRLKLAIPFVWLGCKIAGVGFSVDLEQRWPTTEDPTP